PHGVARAVDSYRVVAELMPYNRRMDKEMWYIYTMEYYAAEKNNDIMKFAGKWMELENVILSEHADVREYLCSCRGDCKSKATKPSKAMVEGAQIIDLMMLVIDVTKGMQTQSAECLVIGQIACQKLVVVLNKIDLLAEGKRQAAIDKMTKKMQKTLENTKFVLIDRRH
ncbi:hypothetical protein STEG23_014471, partial [Scotinomys teguina]